MPLHKARFNRLINRLGQDVAWRSSTACPCADEFSGSPDPQCPQCRGRGFLWAAPVIGTAGITSQNVQKQLREFGQYESGDVIFTIGSDSPIYAIGHMDRAVLLNAEERFSLTRAHGSDDEQFDMPILSVSRVYWLSADKSQIIEGGIPTFDAATRALTWTTGEPPAGQRYSITGLKNVEYFAWDNIPSNRSEQHGDTLPKKLQMRRFDLFGRR
jgi:hypothetical protein